jgi:uncharacterized protein (PEP-CTERM system associated)
VDTSRETRVHSFTAQVGLLRRPAPFGYAIEASTLRERQKADTQDAIGNASALREDGRTEQSAVRATLLYAMTKELEVGLIAGDEKDQRYLRTQAGGITFENQRNFDGGFMGLQATWRPGPRTELKGQIEDRKAARTWSFDASHRLRRTTFAINDRQVATRNAPQSVSAAGMPSQGSGFLPTVPSTPSATQPLADQSTALLSVQRTSGLRVTYTGVRTVLTLLTGQFRARSLLGSGDASNADRSRYQGTEVSYRLTHQLTPTLGLRWSRATDAAGLSRKEQLTTMGLRMRVSPDTSLDGGAAVLNSRSGPSPTSAPERTRVHSVYIRLEHRF